MLLIALLLQISLFVLTLKAMLTLALAGWTLGWVLELRATAAVSWLVDG